MSSLLESLSLPWLIGLFAVSAAAVWFGGSRLVHLVDALTRKTSLGQAFSGMLLLGGVTSLPEMAAVGTSAVSGNASLAVNNLIGTASINLLLLALADAVYGRKALTATAARPTTLMQGTLSMLLSTAVALLATIGDVAIFGVGAGAAALAVAAVAALWLCSHFEKRHVWEVVGERGGDEGGGGPKDDRPLGRIVLLIALAGLLILVAGLVLSVSAERIAERSGVSSGMVGFVLVGAATSLPEVSSVVTAVRLRRYQLAIGDIFGTNLFNILLLVFADALYRKGPVLAEAGRFETVGAMLTVFMTGIFIVGLLERQDRTILRMGYDSVAALVAFALGLAFLAQA